MALDRDGNPISTGDVFVIAGTVRRIEGDTIVIVLGSGMVLRVAAGDVVPIDSLGGGGGGGVTDHGALTGLTPDDDHPQYTKADGTRGFTGAVLGVDSGTAGTLTTRGYLDGQISSLAFFALGAFQPIDPTLTAVAGLATGAGQVTKWTGTDTATQITIGAFGETMLATATATAANTALGNPTRITKPSDQTKNSNTTFAADDALVVSVTSGVRYVFRAVVFFDSAATPDIKFRWTGPATSMQSLHIRGVVGAGTAYANISVDKALSTTDSLAGTGASGCYLMDGIVQFSASGTFALEWAQNTLDPAATTVLRGSYIEYQAL